MLADGTYRKLKKDPTMIDRSSTEGNGGERRDDQGTTIFHAQSFHTSTGCQLYNLSKVHKNGIPLRPIVSAIRSPTYSLSKN